MMVISILIIHIQWFFTSGIIGAILIYQIIDFFRFSFGIKTDLDNLVSSLENDDLSTSFRNVQFIPRFKESEQAINRIKKIILTTKMEKEVQYNFLQILMENIPSGIIVLKGTKLFLINNSAKKILLLKEIFSLDIIKNQYPDFYKSIINQKHVESELIMLNHDLKSIQLSYSISPIKLLKEDAKIINFQNIKSNLEKNELLAWNKLIRTMTHEIMNSVTPIISLSEAGYNISSNNDNPKKLQDLTLKNIEHIQKSFKSIHNKSLWLNEFINDYRKLIRIPQPKLSKINLNEFMNDVIHSMNSIFKEEKIEIENKIENILINIDKNLIEQVLINLFNNAIDSLKSNENKSITVYSESDSQHILLHVIDNGKGIPKEILSEIFVPFFSTKETGSGIGLSVVKQIMHMHDGDVEVISNKKSTTFTLAFNTFNKSS
ncbi:MAG: GHKL domain-containing protein [Bacteroidales bacterium]|nr:GHKL domain-containing protein [Bacteroidales bacterium]